MFCRFLVPGFNLDITECLRGSRLAIIGDNDREILIGDRRLAGGAGGSGVGRGSL